MKTNKEIICINCPMGCILEVEVNGNKIEKISGQGCRKGEIYAAKEIIDPRRIVTSVVPVINGTESMVSVKTASDIPKHLMKDCLLALKDVKVTAPIEIGQVIIENVCGTNVCIIATKRIEKK
jgi:CxxC motif-containing protein